MRGDLVPDVMFGSALGMGALSFVMVGGDIGTHGLGPYNAFVLAVAFATVVGSSIALYVQRQRRVRERQMRGRWTRY